MIEGLLDRDSLRGVECQQLLDEVKEMPVDGVGSRNDFLSCGTSQLTSDTVYRFDTHLKASTSSYILLALPGCFRLRPVKLAPFLEELWFCACARAREPLRHLSHYLFHHGEMLEIVMCLEERDAGVELDQDAAEGEDVTRIGPAQTCKMTRLERSSHAVDGDSLPRMISGAR